MTTGKDRMSPGGDGDCDGRWFMRGMPRSRVFPAVIWLGFVLFPVVDAIETNAPTLDHILTIAGAVVFVVAYLWLVMLWRRRHWRPLPAILFSVLIGVTIALTLASGSSWGFLFTYCAAVAALFSPVEIGWLGVILCAALAAGCSALAGAHSGAVVNYTVTALGIGLLMVLMRDARVRNDELVAARSELARVAVTQERERFARDLHDLLGHSLSVIALKAELAGRLLPERPEQVATEMGEVEQVARQALSEVRLAVSGYRQPTLDGELAGARMALSAAGIKADVDAPKVSLQPDIEAVLAWAVREGATNVIRHSGAQRCRLRVRVGLSTASVEVIDDGSGRRAPADPAGPGNGAGAPHGDSEPAWPRLGGASEPAGHGLAGQRGHGLAGQRGHGLAGLRERAEAIGGHVEAGPLPDGGFRLAVSIPVKPAAPATPGPAAHDTTIPPTTPAEPDATILPRPDATPLSSTTR